MRECNRKLVFVIVFFIIGHNRNQAQGTPEEYGKPDFRDRQNHIFFKNANRGLVHLLNGWQTGKRKPKACIMPAEWKAMSLDIPIGRTFDETMLVDDCKSKTRKPLVSRASAGLMWRTQSVSGLS